jgi:peptidoglycan hydrolase-like protein with peptidoglycan-binding domain
MQRALKDAGYNPGPIDGSIGFQTLAAIESFQRAKGLARGGLTMEALKELGVHLNKVDVADAAAAVP